MEDQVYATVDFGRREIKSFKDFLDKEIGTEYEVHDVTYDKEAYQIMVFDLSTEEVEKIRDFENAIIDREVA